MKLYWTLYFLLCRLEINIFKIYCVSTQYILPSEVRNPHVTIQANNLPLGRTFFNYTQRNPINAYISSNLLQQLRLSNKLDLRRRKLTWMWSPAITVKRNITREIYDGVTSRTISPEWEPSASEIFLLTRQHKIHIFELPYKVLLIIWTTRRPLGVNSGPRVVGLLLGCQIRSEERSRMKISTPQFRKAYREYYAITAILRHEKISIGNHMIASTKDLHCEWYLKIVS